MVALKVDNTTMLRALRFHEAPTTAECCLHDFVINHAEFAPVVDNEMLRQFLREFLERDAEVVVARKEVKDYPLVARYILKRSQRLAQLAALKRAEEQREEAYKQYEMLRRLVCYDNDLLAVTPS
jgi:hypothetical protein